MPVIDVSGVSHDYRLNTGAHPALRDLDVRLTESRVAVLGANGSGKSTLLRLLAGLCFADDGAVAFEGQPLTADRLARNDFAWAFRRRVGLVFQNADLQLFNPTVFDEVAFGPENLMCSPAEIERRVGRALELADAGHLAGRALSELSGGEKQRVAIASVLAMQPQLLVLDEPAAHLDPRATRSVADSLRMIRRDSGLSVVILSLIHISEPTRPY